MPQSHPNKPGNTPDKPGQAILLTPDFLKSWPLPQPDETGDKEDRGRTVIVGGSALMPGAIILAATAALRAGAGKLQIGTAATIQQHVGVAIPESLVFALPETKEAGLAREAIPAIVEKAAHAGSLLIGPGMVHPEAVARLVTGVLKNLEKEQTAPVVVLDAEGFACLKDTPKLFHEHTCQGVITPHAGEMASLLGLEKSEIGRDPARIAREAANYFKLVVALKGSETFIAGPDGTMYHNQSGNIGLATSGSGDVLSGIVAGLAARGAPPIQAAAWAVYLHGRAGDRLAKTLGPLGFLARELLPEIPSLMAGLLPQ
ncbi:MAG: NAD(P)H-hydrate dehydratase [Chloroflexi bacterium]|nr:NAD(P)H-hydrate dehydratase [Chloroflexota bacterium]OJW04296.1 MAG: NAD(P)H-hydrate dehydratase [Chloroflexi bacterium 54-19]